MPDLQPFVSPIDGKVVSGRVALRQHNKIHDVTHPSDFKETWEKARKEREKVFTPGSGYDSARRKEHIKRALEKLNGRRS
jgi:hypothetical protein